MPVPEDLASRTQVARLYFHVMKATVLNTVYKDSPAMQDGSALPDFESRLTMVGHRRLDNTQHLLQTIISEGVQGDFIETGTWRGGSAMFATSVLSAYGQLGKRWVWLADSFKGIPEVKPDQFPDDAVHQGAETLQAHEHNSAAGVVQSFERLGLLPGGSGAVLRRDGPVRILEGYFNETLTKAENQAHFGQRRLSLIRLDGDTYESTIQGLNALYKHLSVGGFVVVDDYMDWVGARKAAQDFRRQHGITSPIVPVFHDKVRFNEHSKGETPRGVWWRKTEDVGPFPSMRGAATSKATTVVALYRALPLSEVDCEACYHLPADPNIPFHYAGTHCPCLEKHQVQDPRPALTMPVPEDLASRTQVARLYFHVMKATVLNTVYKDSPAMQDGSALPDFESRLTMVGHRRLDNTQHLLQTIISEGVQGDFIETGTWRGGSAMFATSVLSAYGQLGKRWVWLADSFKGIPEVKPDQFPDDAVHQGAETLQAHEHNSAAGVVQSFERLGLLPGGSGAVLRRDGPVRILEGYFNETLTKAENQAHFGQRRLSLIRLDGDTYESTIQGLNALYKHLSVGGFVVVDDYMDWVGARKAAQDFRRQHGITSPIVPVFHDKVRFNEHSKGETPRGVWWRKTEEVA